MSRFALLALMLLAAACGADGAGPGSVSGCADVVAAVAQVQPDGNYSFEVTIRSADTGWDKYADLWEVRNADGVVLGTRELLHPHVDEQPFTRSLDGVEVPGDLTSVVVAAHDSVEGFCGETVAVELP